jgi:hypothetical protein
MSDKAMHEIAGIALLGIAAVLRRFVILIVSRRKRHLVAASRDVQADFLVVAVFSHGEDTRFWIISIGFNDDFASHRELIYIASLPLFPWVRDDSGNGAVCGLFGSGILGHGF